jgi:hypothetical protein
MENHDLKYLTIFTLNSQILISTKTGRIKNIGKLYINKKEIISNKSKYNLPFFFFNKSMLINPRFNKVIRMIQWLSEKAYLISIGNTASITAAIREI